MLKTPILHPQILAALGRAGHSSKILIADGNYPSATKRGPNAELVFLNFAPGQMSATDVLQGIVDSVPIESAEVMEPNKIGPYAMKNDPAIFDEFRKILKAHHTDLDLAKLERFAFYEAAGTRDVCLTIATGERRIYANLLLTIGVVTWGAAPMSPMNIVLIGYRGSGKTTVGRLLAQHLGRPFVDTDDLIVARAGKTIREIFAAGGEPLFRDLESQIIKEVAAGGGKVVSAGGGVVLRGENVVNLQANGRLIWLRAGAEKLYERILVDQSTAATRPNLTAAGGLEEVRSLLAIRAPLYAAAAAAVVDVTTLDPPAASAWIIKHVLPQL